MSPDKRDPRGGWSWKAPEREANPELGLLYEPGNWGDVLKGTWALGVARALAAFRRGPAGERVRVSYLDPFAGAPDYPLTAGAAERLLLLGGGPFVEAQAPWTARGRLASTGLLVREALRNEGVEALHRVFDAEPARMQAWSELEGVERLDGASGEDALRRERADLVLIDPYDILPIWPSIRSSVLEAGSTGAVILYVYNRSPRGGQHARDYARLRETLIPPPESVLLAGRAPSDAVLPRAFHEVLLLAPRRAGELARDELARATRRIACKLSTLGAFEEISPSRPPGGGR